MLPHLAALLPFLAIASAAPLRRADGITIHIDGDESFCLAVEELADGSPVVNVPCDNGFHNRWTMQEGNNDNGVRLTGTNFCLDAGSEPANNGEAKIWTCYPGLTQQTWWYTEDKHIAITGGNQCLDLGEDGVQTYQCFSDNCNQIWMTGSSAPPVSSTLAPTSSPSSSATVSSTSVPLPPPTGKAIHVNGDESMCLAVDELADGAPIVNVPCKDSLHSSWIVADGNNDKGIRLEGTNFCLDAGSEPANHGVAKIWTCYPGLTQQTWWYTDDLHIAITGGNQCLDVGQEYVQTYQCFGDATNQIWTTGSSAPPVSSTLAPTSSSSSSATVSSTSVPLPPPTGKAIHVNGDESMCLAVEELADGAPIVNVPCKDSLHSSWIVADGNNDKGIRLEGTNFCLDAGSEPANHGVAKIWTCYPGLTQQTWWYTDDLHIAITGGNQCLDVGQDYVQTYECFGDATNQIWTVGTATVPPVSSTAPPVSSTTPPVSSTTPPVSSTAAPVSSTEAPVSSTEAPVSSTEAPVSSTEAPASSSSSTVPPPVITGAQLLFNGSSTGCLQVGAGHGLEGTRVFINHCATAASYHLHWQLFDVKRSIPGPIPISADRTLCLDASDTGMWDNASPISVQKCDPNRREQMWYYTHDNHLAVFEGNQCLDVRKESVPSKQKPYGTLQETQTWQCNGSNDQQVFII